MLQRPLLMDFTVRKASFEGVTMIVKAPRRMIKVCPAAGWRARRRAHRAFDRAYVWRAGNRKNSDCGSNWRAIDEFYAKRLTAEMSKDALSQLPKDAKKRDSDITHELLRMLQKGEARLNKKRERG